MSRFHQILLSSIAAFVLCVALAPSLVRAVESSPTVRTRMEERIELRQENREESRENRQERRQERIADRCDSVNEKIDDKVGLFDSNKARHVEQYQHLQAKLKEIVARLKAGGADVTQLEADIETLDGKIKAFGQNYAAFIEQLRTARSYSCGHSDGEFLAALQRSRELMKVVQESAKEVWNYYTTVIRPEIVRLKTSVKGE